MQNRAGLGRARERRTHMVEGWREGTGDGGAGPGLRPLHFHPHLPLTLFHPSYPSPRCRKGRCSQKAEESQGSGGTYWGADFPAGEKIRGGSVRVRGQEVTEKPSPTRAQGADLTQHQTPTVCPGKWGAGEHTWPLQGVGISPRRCLQRAGPQVTYLGGGVCGGVGQLGAGS